MQFKAKTGGDSALGSQNFIKLGDKESVRGIFRGEPFDFRQHWDESQQRSINCTGPGCEICAKGDRPKFRFRINFVVKEGDGYVAKIIEQGAKFYEQLKTTHESGYELDKHAMQITRTGKGTSTTYTLMPVQGGAVNEKFEKTLSEVKLNDLSNFKKPEQTSGKQDDSFDANDDIPF